MTSFPSFFRLVATSAVFLMGAATNDSHPLVNAVDSEVGAATRHLRSQRQASRRTEETETPIEEELEKDVGTFGIGCVLLGICPDTGTRHLRGEPTRNLNSQHGA